MATPSPGGCTPWSRASATAWASPWSGCGRFIWGRGPKVGLAGLIGVSPKTLKGWEYRYCSPDNWRRFAEAVRIFLERAEAAKRETDLEEEVNP